MSPPFVVCVCVFNIILFICRLVQHGSYPVITPSNATLRDYMYLHKASVHKVPSVLLILLLTLVVSVFPHFYILVFIILFLFSSKNSWVVLLYKGVSVTPQNAVLPPTTPNTCLLQPSHPVPSHKGFPLQVLTRSAYQPHDATVLAVYSPLPGSWFTAAYIPDWNEQMQQEVEFVCFFSYCNGGSSSSEKEMYKKKSTRAAPANRGQLE